MSSDTRAPLSDSGTDSPYSPTLNGQALQTSPQKAHTWSAPSAYHHPAHSSSAQPSKRTRSEGYSAYVSRSSPVPSQREKEFIDHLLSRYSIDVLISWITAAQASCQWPLAETGTSLILIQFLDTQNTLQNDNFNPTSAFLYAENSQSAASSTTPGPCRTPAICEEPEHVASFHSNDGPPIAHTSPGSEPEVPRVGKKRQSSKNYFCVSCPCPTGFVQKSDWIKHDEESHERQTRFVCNTDGCQESFYILGRYTRHHRTAHGCKGDSCPHINSCEQQPFPKKAAWGCGFCSKALYTFAEREKHLAQHYDQGRTLGDWKHSNVIQGLLNQKSICDHWASVEYQHSYAKKRHQFFWPPEATCELKKDLEYGRRPGAELAMKAWIALRPIEDGHTSPRTGMATFDIDHILSAVASSFDMDGTMPTSTNQGDTSLAQASPFQYDPNNAMGLPDVAHYDDLYSDPSPLSVFDPQI